jgi:hypothetical protein
VFKSTESTAENVGVGVGVPVWTKVVLNFSRKYAPPTVTLKSVPPFESDGAFAEIVS